MEAARPNACTLEITVISGENICVDRSPIAENVYVVVRAESLNCCTTKMVEENGGILAWNEKFVLDIPMHARSITFEVQCKKYKGVRPIGVARIGLSDFLGATNTTSDESGPQMLSYGLRDWDGRRNGVLHLSARVAAPVVPPEDTLCSETKLAKGENFASSSGFDQEAMESSMEKNNSNDDAICIPVWLRYCQNFFRFSFNFGLVRKRKVCD